MAGLVADTHAVVWYLALSKRLSATAQAAIKTTIGQGDPVYVSSVSMVEIVYLSEKRRLPADTFDRIAQALRQPNSGLVPVAFDVTMAEALRSIPSSIVPDMPDRMIAATALHLNLPLVTCDSRLRAAPLITVW